jgi:CHAD domain-containing protein
MAYKLQPGEALAPGLKRIAEEQLSAAIQQLQSPQDLNLGIYEARKYLKKVRSVLRLLAPQLGPVYTEENHRLRDVAQKFGPFRDAHVSLELLDKFAGHYKRKSALNAPRQALVRRQRSTHPEPALADAVASLLATRKRMADWPALQLTQESLQAEIHKTHKQSRHAFEKASKTRTPEDFHELRKSVKRELNQARLLDAADLEPFKTLAALLGDHHNLAVLLTSLENASGRFRTLVRRQMKQLETQILAAGLPKRGDSQPVHLVFKPGKRADCPRV